MLVLSRKVGETIMVGDNVEIMVTRIERDTVRIRISAPREVPIFRGELYREIKRTTGDAPIAPLSTIRERSAHDTDAAVEE